MPPPLAVKVELEPAHIVLVPTTDGVGIELCVIITSSFALVQLLVSVHLKVAVLPNATVTFVVADNAEEIDAVPLTTVHAPVAPDTVFPVTVNVVLPLQRVWSAPALELIEEQP